MENNHHNTIREEDEIDLLQLINKLWRAKKSIAVFTLIFMVIGVLVALFSAKEYTATTIMVPQATDSKSTGGLGGLAAMAGINLGGNNADAIPLTTYSKIIESVPFKKKLAQTKLTFSDIPNPITYEQYCKSYAKPSIWSSVMSIFRSNPSEPSIKIQDTTHITSISREERAILNSIDNNIKLNLNEKEGYITLSYAMPEALPAAQMLQSAQQLLQEKRSSTLYNNVLSKLKKILRQSNTLWQVSKTAIVTFLATCLKRVCNNCKLSIT